MADWDTTFKEEDADSYNNSRRSSESSGYSFLNKENVTLNRMDSEASTEDSERDLILRGAKELDGESKTDATHINESSLTNGHAQPAEVPSRKKLSSYQHIGMNGKEGTARARVAKSPFAPSTIESITEEEVKIPEDGNLTSFTADQMANFLRCLKIDDRLISHLHKKNVNGKRFSKLRDSELENIGLQSHPVILYFREKSRSKPKKDGSAWIL